MDTDVVVVGAGLAGLRCAQALVEAGRVRIDGKRVLKSSEEVRAGQIVALPLRGPVRVLRVVTLPQRRGPPVEARACYEELGANVSQEAPAD